eukprot:g665.t1
MPHKQRPFIVKITLTGGSAGREEEDLATQLEDVASLSLGKNREGGGAHPPIQAAALCKIADSSDEASYFAFVLVEAPGVGAAPVRKFFESLDAVGSAAASAWQGDEQDGKQFRRCNKSEDAKLRLLQLKSDSSCLAYIGDSELTHKIVRAKGAVPADSKLMTSAQDEYLPTKLARDRVSSGSSSAGSSSTSAGNVPVHDTEVRKRRRVGQIGVPMRTHELIETLHNKEMTFFDHRLSALELAVVAAMTDSDAVYDVQRRCGGHRDVYFGGHNLGILHFSRANHPAAEAVYQSFRETMQPVFDNIDHSKLHRTVLIEDLLFRVMNMTQPAGGAGFVALHTDFKGVMNVVWDRNDQLYYKYRVSTNLTDDAAAFMIANTQNPAPGFSLSIERPYAGRSLLMSCVCAGRTHTPICGSRHFFHGSPSGWKSGGVLLVYDIYARSICHAVQLVHQFEQKLTVVKVPT